MIAIAKQEGNVVRVYDEKNSYLFTRPGELQGYTPTTVSIREGSVVRVYDEHDHYMFTR